MPLTYSDAKGHVESRVKVALAAFIGLHMREAAQSPEAWGVLEHYSSQSRKMVKHGGGLRGCCTQHAKNFGRLCSCADPPSTIYF